MKKNTTLLVLLIFLFTIHIKAQETSDDLYELNLEELMNIKINVASKKGLTTRESPGIVTLITSDEIQKSGARDLIDVLGLVPGIQFGTDVQGVISIISRGNWAHEGKVLLLVDGMMMNENFYSTIQLGNHFPVSIIERIEIIRGPGSAIYGGYAELGVINIITKKGEQMDGGFVSVTDGEMAKDFGRRNIVVGLGKKENDLEVSGSVFYGIGHQSDRDFEDFYGSKFNMSGDNSQINSLMMNVDAKYKNLKTKILIDDYGYNNRTIFSQNLPDTMDAVAIKFRNVQSEISYEIKLTEKLNITPKFNYLYQNPYQSKDDQMWNITNTDSLGIYSGQYADYTIKRSNANLIGNYDFNENINLIFGGDYYFDAARDNAIGILDSNMIYQSYVFNANKKKEIDYSSMAAYAQGLLKTKLVNITAGARFDYHEIFGSAFVPRIGFTKAFTKFHFKALASQAFRDPSIANIDLNKEIEPEKTTVFEIEAGVKPHEIIYLTMNLFMNRIEDPIIYYYSSDVEESYYNGKEISTLGFEAECKILHQLGFVNANYSFYQNAKNTVSNYAIPKEGVYLEDNFSNDQLINGDALLGSAQHKIALLASLKLGKHFTINPSAIYYSKRYGFNAVDDNDISLIKEFEPLNLLNINLNYKDFLVKNLSISAAAFNITDEKYSYIQPYNGYHAALPAYSREFVGRLTYLF